MNFKSLLFLSVYKFFVVWYEHVRKFLSCAGELVIQELRNNLRQPCRCCHLTGSSWVTMTNSTTSLRQGFPSILRLGVINALTSTPDLVISFKFRVLLFVLWIKGNIIVVVNGKVLLDEEISFFKNSYSDRPTSLKGKKSLERKSLQM